MRSFAVAKAVLSVAFLAIIFAEGAGQTVVDMRRGERPHAMELFGRAPTERNLRAFESRLEQDSWQARWIRPIAQYARYVTCGDLGAKVLPGRDGWLFYRPGVDYLVQRWPACENASPGMSEALQAVVGFRDALAERGIALLVMIAPGKASVYPGKLSARAAENPVAVRAYTAAFMNELQSAGVPVIDLLERLGKAREGSEDGEHYLALDTHWSPAGVRTAARAVAERIAEEGWIPIGEASYEEREVPVAREGDLIRMVDAASITDRFPIETVECLQIVDSATGQPYADNPDSPLLILGDSFLRIYQTDEPGAAGFIAHLAHALRRPLASIVNDGGASTLVRQELSRKPTLLNGKKLVLWEFVERDLRFGMEGWQPVNLPPAALSEAEGP